MSIASYCVDTGSYTVPAVNGNTECLSGGLRYLDVNNTYYERFIFNNWWKEQISQYGQKINYYINKYSLSAHDYFYGEQPLAGFATPVPMVFAIILNNDSIILSKFGLQGTADLTAIIAIDTFTTTLTSSSLSGIATIYTYEPKHPQLEPKRTLNEPQALLEPRPETRLGVNVYVGDTGDTSFASIGMQPMAPARNLVAGAMLGTVTTSIT